MKLYPAHGSSYETPNLPLGHASLPVISDFVTFSLSGITGAPHADVKAAPLRASGYRTSGC